MSRKASATAIGAFFTGALVLTLGTMIFFGGKLFGSRLGHMNAVVIFTGSVKGLDVGAPVTLRGVKVGEVTDLHVSYDPDQGQFVIPVTIRVDRGELGVVPDMTEHTGLRRLISRGLRAQLKTQSLLTGLLYVDLDFLPHSHARYVEFRTEEPQIPTAPTELEAILQRVSEIDLQSFMQNADQVLRGLSGLLEDPETRQLAGNLNGALIEVRELVSTTKRTVEALDRHVAAMSTSAGALLGELRGQLSGTGSGVQDTLHAIDETLASVRLLSDQAGHVLSEDSPVILQLERTTIELGRAARALHSLADTIEREPEALLRGRRYRSGE